MHYIRIVLFALLCGILGSCATILNKKSYEFRVNGSDKNKVLYKDSVYVLPNKIIVERSKAPLVFTAYNDSIQRTYTLMPDPAPVYLYANMGFVYFAPLAYGIDLTTSKRFHYGKRVWINLNDTSSLTIYQSISENRRRYYSNEFPYKGDTYLSLSAPGVNWFNSDLPRTGERSTEGVGIITVGIEHFYKERKSLEFNIGLITNEIPTDKLQYNHTNVDMKTFFISVIHKHSIPRISLGYGINYSNNYYKEIVYGDRTDLTNNILSTFKSKNHSIGAVFTGYYLFNKVIQAGVVYRPNFLTLGHGSNFQYQHTISLDCTFKLRVKKGVKTPR